MDGWIRVSASSPCPICGKDSNCSTSEDGKAVYCGRVESNRKQNKGGQWLHFLDDGQNTYRSKPIVAPSPKAEKKSTGKGKFKSFQRYVQESKVHPHWVQHYCVPQEIWKRLGCYGDEQALCTPEHPPECFDAVCGVFVRKRGHRFSVTGSERGVTMSRIPSRDSIGVLLVEGASDTGAALAAGLDVIGRHGKGQFLTELMGWLSGVGDGPIILVVERDHQDTEKQAAFFNEECIRAQELSNLLRRPIFVSSPPEGHKDFNAWWKEITRNQGHRLSERDRFPKGQKMLNYLLSSGTEILPGLEVLRQIYQRLAEATECNVNLHVKQLQESATVDGEIDRDYQAMDSCGFPTMLYRSVERGHQVMASFLGCKRWSCPSCRERILRPTWKIHFNHLFANDPQLIHRIAAESLSEAKAILKSIRLLKGRFVRFRFLEGRSAIYTNKLPKQIESTVFDCRRFPFHFDRLSEQISDDIESIDTTLGRFGNPVSTSRSWKLIKDDPKDWKLVAHVTPNRFRKHAKDAGINVIDAEIKVIDSIRDRAMAGVPKTPEGKEQLKQLALLLGIPMFPVREPKICGDLTPENGRIFLYTFKRYYLYRKMRPFLAPFSPQILGLTNEFYGETSLFPSPVKRTTQGLMYRPNQMNKQIHFLIHQMK
jgi:hypothetical protein